MAEPPSKKLKSSGSQTFKQEYSEEWPCIVKSGISVHHAYCMVCRTDFSIGHSGRYDCRTHINGAKHKRLSNAQNSSGSISNMFKSMTSNEFTVTKAELAMAVFIAKHNLPLSVADELPDLVREMCPDSKISKEIKCKRSKTTALINEMSTMTQERLISRMKEGPFSISTDGSNDLGNLKLFPLVVRTVANDGVHSEVLSVPVCEGSATGQKIFSLLDNFFSFHKIPWTNCIALGCDNANVMVGTTSGLYSYCKEKSPNIYLSGCPLHLVHLAAGKGAAVLPITPSDLLHDVYSYFKMSSLRQHRFKEFQEEHEKEQLKILKHGATRWLSMGRCLDRLLENWEPLRDYFKEEAKKTDLSPSAKTKVERIIDALKSRSSRLYIMFLRYSIKPLESFLTSQQTESPQISILMTESARLIRSIMTRFLKPSAFSGNKLVTDVDFKSAYNIKDNSDILIGEACSNFIANKDKNGLSTSKIKEFYPTTIKYFQTMIEYLLKTLPLNNPLLRKLCVADPAQIQNSKSGDIKELLKLFPILSSNTSSDCILEEFADLQSRPLPYEESSCRMDSYWASLMNLKEGELRPFHNIGKAMLGLLTIPHNSAHCERIFSAVRKIQTDQRSSLATTTLESLLILKHCQESTFHHKALTTPDLKRLKRAYTNSLASQ